MRKTGLVFLLTLVLCFTGSLTAFGRTEGHVFDEAGSIPRRKRQI